jgi:hypothetical protein
MTLIAACALAAQTPRVTLPANPVAATMPAFRAVTGPGDMHPGLQPLPAGEDLGRYKYLVKEYFLSGIAQGQPYTTRMLVRRPADPRKFSGIVLAEPMHPTGNSWVFHFAHTWVLAEGHTSVEITTGSVPLLRQANPERYKELEILNGQANEILAQAGLLLKSTERSDGPMEALVVRRMILMGTSASAAAVAAYLPAHTVYRNVDMRPIFDGFLPTSIGGRSPLPKVDVPVIMIPTMTEVVAEAEDGNRYRRADGDAPGDQFRLYEVAAMAHNDSRINPVYNPDPCRYPVSRFPQGMGVAIGLDRLIQWIDKGVVPPRAEPVTVDNDTAGDGSVLALDVNGNPKGGVRNVYVDVPAYRYVSPNEANPTPIPNPSPLTAAATVQLFCGIAGYQQPLAPAQLKTLYKNKKDYQSKVEKRADELIKAGWLSPVYRELILADAAKVAW